MTKQCMCKKNIKILNTGDTKSDKKLQKKSLFAIFCVYKTCNKERHTIINSTLSTFD